MAALEARLAQFVVGLRERDSHRARLESERRERLLEALPEAVGALVTEFGATGVILFGSLARGEAGLESDVDLLVDGLPMERLFEATALVSRVLQADVDLVPSEAARPGVRERALSEGRVLHARDVSSIDTVERYG
jgi:predicted nucleotidyltransferase